MGYAQIIKDAAGKPTGYRECDGEVCWMPQRQSYDREFRTVKLDVGTMAALNHDFIKDASRVYRQGRLLKGVTPGDFRVLNGVFVGGSGGIWTPYGDAKIAHPESFEALDDGSVAPGEVFPQSYGRDEEFVYFFSGSTDSGRAYRLRACKDPASFVLLSRNYGRDGQRVYYREWTVKGADPETFVVTGPHDGRDKKGIYHASLSVSNTSDT